jgi:hypothetical protein
MSSGDMGSPQHVPTGTDGSYSFEGDPGLSHLIGTIHSGVTYSMVAEPGELPAKELKIFETTTDVSAVDVVADTLTVVPQRAGTSDVLEIFQLLRFRNRTDRTFTGESPGGGVLKLPVPESAFDLAPATDSDTQQLAMTPKGVMSTAPLQPGELSLPFLYRVRVPRSGWQLRREVFYPTEHVDLLVAEGLQVQTAPGFEFQEKANIGDRRYDRYRSDDLLPGRVIASDIGFTASRSDSGAWYGAAAILGGVAAALLAGIFTLHRRRAAAKVGASRARAGRAPASPSMGANSFQTPPASAPNRQELIDRVALLDESFDAGGLDRDEYQSQRSELIAQLKGARAAAP